VWEGNAWDDWSNDIGGPGRLTKSGIGWLRLSGTTALPVPTWRKASRELTGDNHFTANRR
jgi:subtilase-type serine protease